MSYGQGELQNKFLFYHADYIPHCGAVNRLCNFSKIGLVKCQHYEYGEFTKLHLLHFPYMLDLMAL